MASWVVKALVEATPISGPASVRSSPSASRASVLSGTLTTASVGWPSAFTWRIAASVSAVSPDWETKTPASPSTSGVSR